MPVNIAARRGAKNQRRKAVVAEKRKAELALSGIAGQVRQAQTEPIQHCLISDTIFEVGMGMVVLARGATPYSLTMATFLLDTLGLGVKDVFLRSLSDRAFAAHMEYASFGAPMAPIEPHHARKLLHDLVAWARTHGVAPHRDYAKIEPLFGAVDATASNLKFPFGCLALAKLVDDAVDGELIEAESNAAD
jgi:hypothetical protein